MWLSFRASLKFGRNIYGGCGDMGKGRKTWMDTT